MENSNLVFRPVRCPESALETLAPIDGHIVFTTDTRKIFMAKDNEFKMMGGSSGVFYGNKILTDNEKYGDSAIIYFVPTDIDGDEQPQVDDLILNIPDGGFYRVLTVGAVDIMTQRIAVSGSGTGGGGGDTPSMGSLAIKQITPQMATTLVGDEFYIEYEIVATDVLGQPILEDGEAIWTINGKQYKETVTHGKQRFKVDQYLDPTQDRTTVQVLVTIPNTLRPIGSTWKIKAVSLGLDWKWNYTSANYINKDTFTLNFTPSGGVDCTAHIVFDDAYVPGETYFTKEIKSYETGRLTYTDPLPSLSYGAHTCEMYLTTIVNGEEYRTPSIFNEITFISGGEYTLLTVPYYEKTATQYDTLKIPFMVYDADLESCAVSFYVNGNRVGGDTYNREVQYWPYTLSESGAVKLTIKTDNEESKVDIELIVDKLTLDATEVTGYTFALKAKDFSSNDELRNWKNGTIDLEFSDNFDWENGGLKFDEKKDGSIEKYICVRQGTRMIINHAPFYEDSRTASEGKTLKFCFKTANCYDYDAPVLSCYDNNIGIRLDAQQAILSSNSYPDFTTQYFENTYIELEGEIWPNVPDPDAENKLFGDRFMMFWIDGIPAGVKVLSEDDYKTFPTSNSKIIVGSDLCDVHLYVAKVYPRKLTEDEHLNNFIMDAPSTEEMLKRYRRNDILDNTGEISYTRLVEQNPDCHVYMYEMDRMTTSKEDVVSGCAYTELYGEYNSLDNPYYRANNTDVYVQGTSSAAYGAAAFNLRTEFLEGLIDRNGEAVEGWKVTDDAEEIDLTCTKVNVASCENCNNVVNAEWYNKYQPYHDAHRRQGVEKGKSYRDTMQFESGVVFIKDKNPNDEYLMEGDVKDRTSKYLAANCFLDSSRNGVPYAKNPYYKMYAIGNMGNDKKNRSIFHDTKNINCCCVEVLDNQNDKHWMTNSNLDIEDFVWSDEDDGFYEFRYSSEKYKGSDPIPGGLSKDEYAKQVQAPAFLEFVRWMAESDPCPKAQDHPNGYNASHILKAQAVELTAETYKKNVYFVQQDEVYIKAINEFDGNQTYYKIIAEKAEDGDIPAQVKFDTYTFKGFDPPGYEGETNPSKVTLKGFQVSSYAGIYTNDTREYRIAKMLSECEDHLIMDSVIFHYLFVQRHTMVDNIAKNTFWSTEDLIHWDLTKDYDNDTSDGNNNSGYLTFTYGIEMLDTLPGGADIFNASQSVWLNFCHQLPTVQENLHQQLADAGAWDASTYLAECARHQNKIPERCWIANYFHHYIRPRRLGLDEGTFLERLEGGKKTHQRTQYENYQEFYLNSKYLAGTAFTDSAAIDMRLNKKPSVNYIQCTEMDEYQADEIYYILNEQGEYVQVDDSFKEEIFNANKTNYYILEGQWDANNKLTVSFYTDCYPSIHIGGQIHRSPQRVKRGFTYDLPVGTMIQSANDSTCYLYGASMLQTLTGLADTYPSYVKLANASRLREIAYGSDDPNYYNPNLRQLNIGSNTMLQKAQAQNSGLLTGIGATELKQAKQLQELLLDGSTLKSLTLPEDGIIETLKLSALTALSASNLTKLETVEMDEGIYTAMNSLSIKNCPKLDEHTYRMVLEGPVSTYSLIDFVWEITNAEDLAVDENGKVTGIKVVDKLMTKYADGGKPATALIGEIIINVNCNIDEFEIYKKYCITYPNLIIKYTDAVEGLDPAVELKFMTGEGETAQVHYRVLGSGDADGDSVGKLISAEGPLGVAITVPQRGDTTEQTFTFTGYWIDEDGKRYYQDGAVDAPVQDSTNFNTYIPTESKVFYPEFTTNTRFYEIKFYDNDGNVIKQNGEDYFLVAYGNTYTYQGGPMTNYWYLDSSNLKDDERYGFRGWSTNKYGIGEAINPTYFDLDNTPIEKDIILYPHYVIEDVHKVATSEKYFNINNGTITMKEEYKQVLEGKITIPSYVNSELVTTVGQMHLYYVDGLPQDSKITHYYFLNDSKVEKIGNSAFAYQRTVQLIDLPLTVRYIDRSAFTDCRNLVSVTLNDNIHTIEAQAFANCESLKLTELPKSLTFLGVSAFMSNYELEISSLPEGIEEVPAYCFATCRKIKMSEFGSDDSSGSKLSIIGEGAFTNSGYAESSGLDITNIYIKRSVSAIYDNAFSTYAHTTLKNVYFTRSESEYDRNYSAMGFPTNGSVTISFDYQG